LCAYSLDETVACTKLNIGETVLMLAPKKVVSFHILCGLNLFSKERKIVGGIALYNLINRQQIALKFQLRRKKINIDNKTRLGYPDGL